MTCGLPVVIVSFFWRGGGKFTSYNFRRGKQNIGHLTCHFIITKCQQLPVLTCTKHWTTLEITCHVWSPQYQIDKTMKACRGQGAVLDDLQGLHCAVIPFFFLVLILVSGCGTFHVQASLGYRFQLIYCMRVPTCQEPFHFVMWRSISFCCSHSFFFHCSLYYSFSPNFSRIVWAVVSVPLPLCAVQRGAALSWRFLVSPCYHFKAAEVRNETGLWAWEQQLGLSLLRFKL